MAGDKHCYIDGNEVALRILEAIHEIDRPDGIDAAEVMAAMPDHIRTRYRAAARSCITLFAEAIKAESVIEHVICRKPASEEVKH